MRLQSRSGPDLSLPRCSSVALPRAEAPVAPPTNSAVPKFPGSRSALAERHFLLSSPLPTNPAFSLASVSSFPAACAQPLSPLPLPRSAPQQNPHFRHLAAKKNSPIRLLLPPRPLLPRPSLGPQVPGSVAPQKPRRLPQPPRRVSPSGFRTPAVCLPT